ncbi:MAG: hypothetical protein ACE367_18985 [Acidimicrobiales bacterium]
MSTPRGERWVHAAANTPTNVGAAPRTPTSGHSATDDRRYRAASERLWGAEAAYLRDVAKALADVAEPHRTRLLADVAAQLAARPSAAVPQELWRDLGEPSKFARELKRTLPQPTPPRPWMQSALQRTWVMLGLAGAAVVALFALWQSVHHIEPPAISNACGGVGGVSVAVENSGSSTTYRIDYRQGGRYNLQICPVLAERIDPSEVELVGVRTSNGLSSLSHIALSTVEPRRNVVGRFNSIEPIGRSFGDFSGLWLWMEFDFCGNGGRNSAWGLSPIEFDVRYAGRSFTVPVDLGSMAMVRAPRRAECPTDGRDVRSVLRQILARSHPDEWSERLDTLLNIEAEAAADLCRGLRDGARGLPAERRAVFSLPDERIEPVAMAGVRVVCPDRREQVADLLDELTP